MSCNPSFGNKFICFLYCRTVVNKLDGITSEFRNFELELVAGEPNYVAEVIEDGIRYKMDFDTTLAYITK